jgi:hypothetical protein
LLLALLKRHNNARMNNETSGVVYSPVRRQGTRGLQWEP